jgi:hypothetical protein
MWFTSTSNIKCLGRGVFVFLINYAIRLYHHPAGDSVDGLPVRCLTSSRTVKSLAACGARAKLLTSSLPSAAPKVGAEQKLGAIESPLSSNCHLWMFLAANQSQRKRWALSEPRSTADARGQRQIWVKMQACRPGSFELVQVEHLNVPPDECSSQAVACSSRRRPFMTERLRLNLSIRQKPSSRSASICPRLAAREQSPEPASKLRSSLVPPLLLNMITASE